MTEAFPLQWPHGRPRVGRVERSRFNVTFAQARDELFRELALMGARLVVLSTNVELRLDGLPYAGKGEPDDGGVAVYFECKGRPMCFACDRWNRVKDNIQAVRHTVGALRGLERWGTGDMVQAAFSGFVALPPPGGDWRAVLGVEGLDCSIPAVALAGAEAAYRTKAKDAHPDSGGTAEEMARLNGAIEQARAEFGKAA